MIEIRPLRDEELLAAMDLKVRCWSEELAGRAENSLSAEKELSFFREWIEGETENEDLRILLGVFEEGQLLGVAIGSFAEEEDGKDAMELNGLWVEESARGRGISLLLLRSLISPSLAEGKDTMVVYSHDHAPSNSFYRRFQGERLWQERQLGGKLLIDVFQLNLPALQDQVNKDMERYQL
jgi:L-amino acid N-acyltransferase YncA